MTTRLCRLMRHGNIRSSNQIPLIVSVIFITSFAADTLHLFTQLYIGGQAFLLPPLCSLTWMASIIMSFASLVFSSISTYHIVFGLGDAFQSVRQFDIFYQLTVFMRLLAHFVKTTAMAALIFESAGEVVDGEWIDRIFTALTLCLAIRDLLEILNQSLYVIYYRRIRERLCQLIFNLVQIVVSLSLTSIVVLVIYRPDLLYKGDFSSIIMYAVSFAMISVTFLHVISFTVRLLVEVCLWQNRPEIPN